MRWITVLIISGILLISGCISETGMITGNEILDDSTYYEEGYSDSSNSEGTDYDYDDGTLFNFIDYDNNFTISGQVYVNNHYFANTTRGSVFVYNDYLQDTASELKPEEPNTICIIGSFETDNEEYGEIQYPLCYELKGWEIDYYGIFDLEVRSEEYRINQRTVYGKQYMNFITPEEVSYLLEDDKLDLSGDVYDDLESIHSLVTRLVSYRRDEVMMKSLNYVSYPSETIENHYGDCEDWSLLLLSVFRAYDNSIECHNVMLPSHITTICVFHEEGFDKFRIYDQKTKISTGVKKDDTSENRLREIRKFWNGYAETYYLRNNEKQPLFAFNDKDYVEFESEEDFINWVGG